MTAAPAIRICADAIKVTLAKLTLTIAVVRLSLSVHHGEIPAFAGMTVGGVE